MNHLVVLEKIVRVRSNESMTDELKFQLDCCKTVRMFRVCNRSSFRLTRVCVCGGDVWGLMSSSSVVVGLCGLLTSRLPSLTIPGIWVILTWWGFAELFFRKEWPLLEEEWPAACKEELQKWEVIWLLCEWKTQIKPKIPLDTTSEFVLLLWPLTAEDEDMSSPLIPFCSKRILLFFFGRISSKSSSSQSPARYSSSGTSAEVLLDDTAAVLESWGCDRPFRRALALPKPRIALWYSSRSKTEVAEGSLACSRPELGTELASAFGGNSWLVVRKLLLGRTGRRGLTERSESLSSEMRFYKIKTKLTVFQ